MQDGSAALPLGIDLQIAEAAQSFTLHPFVPWW